MYIRGDIKLLLVADNNRLILEIEIVHDLSCHPIGPVHYIVKLNTESV